MLSQDVIYAFKEGDSRAFKNLYNLFYDDVWSLCYKYTRNHETAEELAHDSFLLLWENHSAVDPEQGVKPYLLTITRNEVFRWLRKSAGNAAMKEALKKQFIHEQQAVRQDVAMEATLDLLRFKECLNALPAKRKKVFELIRFSDLTYNEVAVLLSISRDAVKDHMIKANKSLLKLKNSGEFTYHLLLLSTILLG